MIFFIDRGGTEQFLSAFWFNLHCDPTSGVNICPMDGKTMLPGLPLAGDGGGEGVQVSESPGVGGR